MHWFRARCAPPVPPPLTLTAYINYRLGRDARAQARNFLGKPFSAPSFTKFWWYWNPVVGYYLYYYSYRPLRAWLPRWLAVWTTFLICGVLHDLPFGVVAAVRGQHPPPYTITLMFALLGLVVILSDRGKLTFDRLPCVLRWSVHALTIGLCWRVALYLTSAT